MIGGRLLRGAHHQAGVLGGHLVADAFGRPCSCGGVGCVEAEASTWALPQIARSWPGFAGSALAARAELDFAALFACADEGDGVAAAIRDRCLRVWSAGAVSMVHAWDPELLVVGGGVMRRAQAVLPAIEAHVHAHAWTPWGKVRVLRRGARRAGGPARGRAAAGRVIGSSEKRDAQTRQLRQGALHPRGPGLRLRHGVDGDRAAAAAAGQASPLRPRGRVLSRGGRRRGPPRARRGARARARDRRAAGVQGRLRDRADLRALPRRRPRVRPHERPRARRLRRPGTPPPAGGPDRGGARRARARGRSRGDAGHDAGRAGLRGPRPLGDPAAPAPARGLEPRGPRQAGARPEAVQARLLRRLARRRPAEAPAARRDRLAARHERRGAPKLVAGDALRRGLAQHGATGRSAWCRSSIPARGAGSG